MKLKLVDCFLGPWRNAHGRPRKRAPQSHLDRSFPLMRDTQLLITRTSESIEGERIQASTDAEHIQRVPPKSITSITPLVQGESNSHLSPSVCSGRSSRGDSFSSHRTTSRDSSCSKSSTAGDSLSAQLRCARTECHQRPLFFFVPICDQESLITVHNVEKDIWGIEPAEITDIAKRACLVAPKLFAILAYLRKGPEIRFLLDEGLSDKDLPLKRSKSEKGGFVLQTALGVPIKAFERWDDDVIEEFDRMQWWMIAPVFENGKHHELDERIILPFIPFETNPETAEVKEGGYSEVYVARIHRSHHNFWPRSESENGEPLVAVKRLFSSDKKEFEKEESILRALGSGGEKHPHLITLLATFRHKKKYHLVFRYADANLRKYWESKPSPDFNETTVLWSLKQMVGIADAIKLVHNFPVAHPLSVDNKVRLHKDAKLCVEESEELYGRHGDIKPENILWFHKTPEVADENGVLQLADFGLGRFHGRDSRSKVPWKEVIGGSPTYEPPECKLHKPVSRAYDIWSIGCLYLEFTTWLLKGSEAITSFSRARGKIPPSSDTDGDHFFTINSGGNDAVVQKEVIIWVQQLHEHDKCSAVIHDLLDLVMDKVLLPDSKARISARELLLQLDACLAKARVDKDYLLKPVPRPHELHGDPPSKLAPKAVNAPGANKKTGNSFAAQPKTPRDLVGRGAGTPGSLKRSQTCWP